MPRAPNPNDPRTEQPAPDCASIEALVEGSIRRLMPTAPEIAVRFAVPTDRRSEIMVEELLAISGAIGNAADRRIHDFTTGRVLARNAMQALGLPSGAIARGSGRTPRWPLYCVGSITHAEGLACSAVARAGELAGLGIDLELAGRVRGSLHRKVLTSRELAELGATDTAAVRHATLRFSAKEAVYKAVNPIVGRFIGFQEVEVVIGRRLDMTREPGRGQTSVGPADGVSATPGESGLFGMRYVGDHATNRIMESGSGFYCFFGRYVFTLFIIP